MSKSLSPKTPEILSARPRVNAGRKPTPFHARQVEKSETNDWTLWAGYSIPNSYTSVELEYFSIRNGATLYDISPMCKYRIKGPDAERFMNRFVPRDVRKIKPGRVAYAIWCNDDGHVLDDGTIFRFGPDDFRLCSQERQYAWLMDSALGFDVEILDETDDIAALQFQGPTTFAILEAMGLKGVETLKPFDLQHFSFAGTELMISRTGFTGDLGYELWIEPGKALELWDALMAAGADRTISPVGSLALDMTRIEAGFIQPAVDFLHAEHVVRHTRGRSPFELGLDWQVDFTKGHFTGRRALLKEKEANSSRYCFVGLEIEGNKPAHNALVYHKQKKEIGHITSAVWSPTMKNNLAMALLQRPFGVDITEDLWVEIYVDKELKWDRVMARAKIVDRPFFNPPRKRQTPPARF
ncbi:aminomethyltransferase family protein [Kiloniella laminariae]|uniref:aminomethyltransferase family protein n=1 Tax=Kiloniella laminariae TaxID=454162 RepID=UPI00035F4FD0|nr:aminomethyltransferase family protein [Kiloniella laminariae]